MTTTAPNQGARLQCKTAQRDAAYYRLLAKSSTPRPTPEDPTKLPNLTSTAELFTFNNPSTRHRPSSVNPQPQQNPNDRVKMSCKEQLGQMEIKEQAPSNVHYFVPKCGRTFSAQLQVTVSAYQGYLKCLKVSSHISITELSSCATGGHTIKPAHVT